MANGKPRGVVKIPGHVHEKLKRHCAATNQKIEGLVGLIIESWLNGKGRVELEFLTSSKKHEK